MRLNNFTIIKTFIIYSYDYQKLLYVILNLEKNFFFLITLNFCFLFN